MDKRKNIYIWLIVILLVTNIATIISIVYHVNTEVEASNNKAVEMPAEQRTRFLREQLNLDAEQMEYFRNINRSYNRSANPVTHDLESLRSEMLQEMGKENPNEARLEEITTQIGGLHKELKKTTIEFYLQMKSVCNDEQKEKLYQIFHAMLNQEEDVKLPRGGHGQGRGRNRNSN